LKEWDQCLLMLGDAKVDEHGDVYDTKDCNVMYLDKDSEDREINVSFFFNEKLFFFLLGCVSYAIFNWQDWIFFLTFKVLFFVS